MYKIMKTFHKHLREKCTRPINLPSTANSSPRYNYNTSYIHLLKSYPPIFYDIQHTYMSPQITQFIQPLSYAHKNNNNNNPFVNTLAQSKNTQSNLGPLANITIYLPTSLKRRQTKCFQPNSTTQ